MNRKVKIIGICLAVVVLVVSVGYFFILPALLSGEYVKGKIVELVKSSMGAELSFETFEIDIKSGHVDLGGVKFVQDKPETTFKAEVESATMDIELRPLLRKKVHVKKLELERPSISLVRKPVRVIEEVHFGSSQSQAYKRSEDIVVDEIIITDGKFDYVGDTVEGEHSEAKFGGLDYTVTDITLTTLPRLVSASNLEVTDVRLIHKDTKSDLELTTDRLVVKNDPEEAKYNLYKVDSVEIYKPQIRYAVQREPERPPTSVKDKVIGFINKKLTEEKTQKQEDEAKILDRFLYMIENLEIYYGQVGYAATREGVEPFEVELTNLEYHARDISYKTFGNLVIGADIEADIDMGGKGKLHKKAYEGWSEFELSGVNFGYMDRYFSQLDALAIDSGMVDVKYDIEYGDRGFYEMKLSDFELGLNSEAKSQRFMLIPVEKITEFVNKREGDVNLRFELDSKFEVSDDFEDIVMKMWDGMWMEIFEYITVEGVDAAVEKLPLNEKAEKFKGFIEKAIKERKKE